VPGALKAVIGETWSAAIGLRRNFKQKRQIHA